MVLMDLFPGMDSSFNSQSCSEKESPTQSSKKRRRPPLTNEDIMAAFTGVARPRGRPRIASKTSLTATHELRLLRAQVASMEEELHGLQSEWTKQLPDERVLTTARHTASKKREVAVTEAAHIELQEMHLQQQLMFATLQAAILRAPLHSSGQDILKSLHFDTRFGRDPEVRIKMLNAHNERSLATVPSTMNRFTQMAINKVLALQDEEGRGSRSILPVSQIDITGCKNYTLVTSVFMSEIPHTSVEDVYAAALAYHDAIPATMKRHFGVDATRTRLNGADAPAAYWRLNLAGVGLPATVNHILCSELTPSHGMIHMDAVVDDPFYPTSQSSPLEYGISGLTMTPRKDPLTGKTVAVALRWVVLYRYKLFPDDPALKKDLEIIRPILNGDLITASVCRYIHELQQRQSPRN
ncbi:hypothetical protein PC129_g15096 [Phytophthora cactorum]|uniref:Uncharacterized protein n=2 Tax=Phytophthora cactorum TaxID=29920 RepID=A0A329RUC9_9STRA|nr:hypothetical protein Pcac1_g21522 [Phytophthora cactorum]KAG2809173.1 hypothetical protein PC112_g16620 [Phytophthora cactorum]KAG2810795.1 hypothetical protein PC111_g15499 [Phytophthora cactorum]KAG2850563.1 hypothetical protein PC113_g16674 [Phytophthora cactorum]KAG2891126.1 hypothetical protein PC114_g17114 [Phytophthora cactorum]